MSIIFTPTTNGVTLDETGGLQFNGSPDDTAGATDNDDSDVSLATLLAQSATLYNYLFTTLALSTSFSNADGVAHGTIGTATSDTPITSIDFAFTDGAFSGLFTVNGTKLYLYSTALFPDLVLLREADGSGNPNPTGTIAAAINLDVNVDGTSTSEDVSVWMVQFEALKDSDPTNPDDTVTLANLSLSVGTSISFDFEGAPSGSNYFMLFGSQSAALLISGGNPVDDTTTTNISAGDTVVSSQGGGPTTLGVNNQMLNPGEGMHIRYVTLANTDFLVPDLSPTEANVEANTAANGFVDAAGASVTFSQTQPGGGAGQYFTVSLTAYSADKSAALETGTHYAEELDNDTKVDIKSTGIQVLRGGVNVVGTDPPGSAPAITASVVNGVLTVSGLKAGDEVFYTTNGNHNHVFIQAVSGANFDIGGFSLLSSETTPFAINNIHFDDAAPTAHVSDGGGTVTIDETAGAQDNDTTAPAVLALFDTEVVNKSTDLPTAQFAISTTPLVSTSTSVGGADGIQSTSFALAIVGGNGTDSLLDTTDGKNILLFKEGDLIVGRYDIANGTVDQTDPAAFAIAIGQDGNAAIALYASLHHPIATNPDDQVDLAGFVNVVATVTDGDGDTSTASFGIGDKLNFDDDGPTITAPFDADPGTAGIQTPEKLGNAAGQTASGTFGYDIGADDHLAAFYAGGGSDFVDTNGALAGVQISLTGTVDNAQNPNIASAVATLTSESLTSASFTFSFHYDKDPITAGVQDSTAGGTLVFDKAADTYTFTLTDPIDGFTFDVLHTNELIAKEPTGNTGHPLIVAEQLTANNDPNPFFVQFTANSTTQQIGFGFNSTGDGAPNGPPTDVSFTGSAHDMVTNTNEDWVSATQLTNGVAGDTIQKGELLTLRFFKENILSDVDPNASGGGTERLDPTTSASGVAIKFDGIGNSEDLVLILDLKDANGNEVTRAVNVENSDLIKGNANIPAPYNTEFTLDNNDALLIIEQNDYTVAGETYQIQGLQIMQSGNGLTGNAINLNGATGAGGGSSATSNLTAWDTVDQDVLKIVDIAFVQQTSGTIDANLDFAFALVDADGDPTATQHIAVNVSNDFIV